MLSPHAQDVYFAAWWGRLCRGAGDDGSPHTPVQSTSSWRAVPGLCLSNGLFLFVLVGHIALWDKVMKILKPSSRIFWASNIFRASDGTRFSMQLYSNLIFRMRKIPAWQFVHKVINSWMTALLSETFLLGFRVGWEIRLESYDPRCKAVTVCKLRSRTYIAIWCTTMHDNKTHIAFDCTTHQTMALYTANNALFYKNKVGQPTSWLASCCSP